MRFLVAAVLVVGGALLFSSLFKCITIFEFERGLRFKRGRFRKVLAPGRYWYMPHATLIQKVDVRPHFVTITGQEVLSADGVTLKISLAANFQVSDPAVAVLSARNVEDALYQEIQNALRALIGATEIDAVLNNRRELSTQLLNLTEARAKDLGLTLIAVHIKDIMFPGKLKEMFAQVVKAKKEGQAALEKARGETAALRNLANAARMLDDNPNLMHLRLLQSLGESTGNTLVLGMPAQGLPIPVSKGKDHRIVEEEIEQG